MTDKEVYRKLKDIPGGALVEAVIRESVDGRIGMSVEHSFPGASVYTYFSWPYRDNLEIAKHFADEYLLRIS